MFEVSRNEMYIVQGPKLQCLENLITSLYVRSKSTTCTYLSIVYFQFNKNVPTDTNSRDLTVTTKTSI